MVRVISPRGRASPPDPISRAQNTGGGQIRRFLRAKTGQTNSPGRTRTYNQVINSHFGTICARLRIVRGRTKKSFDIGKVTL